MLLKIPRHLGRHVTVTFLSQVSLFNSLLVARGCRGVGRRRFESRLVWSSTVKHIGSAFHSSRSIFRRCSCGPPRLSSNLFPLCSPRSSFRSFVVCPVFFSLVVPKSVQFWRCYCHLFAVIQCKALKKALWKSL